MPTPAQTQALERYSVEVWGEGNLAAIDDVFAPNLIRHGPDIEGGVTEGAKGLKDLVTLFRTAMPDLKVPIHTTVGEGDVVLSRWTAQGTQDGPLLGAAPTGKRCEVGGFWMHRFEDGRIVEEWATYDTLGYVQQVELTLP